MKRMQLFMSVLFVVFFIMASANAQTMFNNHLYLVLTSSGISWQNARTSAQALGDGWDLAAITSAEEQQFIQSLVGPANPGGAIIEYWLGGYQSAYYSGQLPADDWNWVTGEPWGYANWGPSEPNDWDGPGSEQYLAIDDRWDWRWNDNSLSNGQIHGFIAEAPIPEPGSLLLLGSGILALGFVRLYRKRNV